MFKTVIFIGIAFLIVTCSDMSDDKKQKDPIEPTLYYEMNIDTLNQEQLQIVDSIGKYLRNNPNVKVEVIGLGHPKEINFQNGPNGIAYKRSQKVINYLVTNLNIDSKRISLGEKVIGPKLGEDPKKFQAPEESEFRKVYFVFEN